MTINLNIGVWNYYEEFSRNRLFDPKSYLRDDNLYYPFLCLKNESLKKGFNMDTLDMYPLDHFDVFIFFDIPRIDLLDKIKSINQNLFLVIFESEIIKPDNWDKNLHKYFKKSLPGMMIG